MLCEIERKIGLSELLISHIPILRSFLSKGQSVSLAALTALTKLAINDGHKSSLHEQFDQELQVAGKSGNSVSSRNAALDYYVIPQLQSCTIWTSFKMSCKILDQITF